MKKQIEIVVNATAKMVTGKEISFADVVQLVYPDYVPDSRKTYSVEYENGRGNTKEGSLAKGGVVKIKEGTEFRISPTGES